MCFLGLGLCVCACLYVQTVKCWHTLNQEEDEEEEQSTEHQTCFCLSLNRVFKLGKGLAGGGGNNTVQIGLKSVGEAIWLISDKICVT